MPVPPKPVLLIRPDGRNDGDTAALARYGIPCVVDPYLMVGPATDPDATLHATRLMRTARQHADWFVITSASAVHALVELLGSTVFAAALTAGTVRGLRISAVGHATASALQRYGPFTIHCPPHATATALAALLQQFSARAHIVLPQGNQALPTLRDTLAAAGWTIDTAVVYTTAAVTVAPASAADIAKGRFSAVVLRSPSAARALHLYSPTLPPETRLVCGGTTTAAAASRLYDVPIVTSSAADPDAVAETVWSTLVADESETAP